VRAQPERGAHRQIESVQPKEAHTHAPNVKRIKQATKRHDDDDAKRRRVGGRCGGRRQRRRLLVVGGGASSACVVARLAGRTDQRLAQQSVAAAAANEVARDLRHPAARARSQQQKDNRLATTNDAATHKDCSANTNIGGT
jgi:hypothetical protein